MRVPVFLSLLSAATALSVPQQQTLVDSSKKDSGLCPLASKVPTPDDGFLSSLRFVEDEFFRAQQVQRLSKAVQVPTTVGDHMIDPFDEGFAPFVEFQELLQSLFPLVYVYKSCETWFDSWFPDSSHSKHGSR